MKTTFDSISHSDLDKITGGAYDGDGGGGDPGPGPDGPDGGGTSSAGESLKKLASTEEGRKLLADTFGTRRGRKHL